jgi:hypothetical protein
MANRIVNYLDASHNLFRAMLLLEKFLHQAREHSGCRHLLDGSKIYDDLSWGQVRDREVLSMEWEKQLIDASGNFSSKERSTT